MLCGQQERATSATPAAPKVEASSSGFRFLSSFRALAPWCPVPGVPLRSTPGSPYLAPSALVPVANLSLLYSFHSRVRRSMMFFFACFRCHD
jgi:hypothetical protein